MGDQISSSPSTQARRRLIHRGRASEEGEEGEGGRGGMTVTERGQGGETTEEGEEREKRNGLQILESGMQESRRRGYQPLCSSAEKHRGRESERESEWEREREGATQAKRLKWITVGQTSEEDKTANMSHCSLLAFNNRCLVSLSPLTLPQVGLT